MVLILLKYYKVQYHTNYNILFLFCQYLSAVNIT